MTETTTIQRVTEWPQRTKDYFAELKAEMKRVTWPSRKQVQATTLIVIVTVFAFAAYFAVVDTLLTRAINGIYQGLTR